MKGKVLRLVVLFGLFVMLAGVAPCDEDDDGVGDIYERLTGTDYQDPDTDDDGLCDGELTVAGVCVTGEDMNYNGQVNAGETNPRLADTDGGGEPDGSEVFNGRDPLDPADDVVPACYDTLDNDADNLIDWPEDPDCDSMNDDTEMDPAEVGTLNTGAFTQGIDMQGDYAYLAGYYYLKIVNVSDPTHPQLEGMVDTPGDAFDVVVRGDYAYVADWWYFTVVDISDPTAPEVVAQLDYMYSPNGFVGVYVSGDYAYMTGYGGLLIIDVSDPTDPFEAGGYLGTGFECVVAEGDYAYAAGYGTDLTILEVSDPTDPQVLETVAGAAGRDIKKRGNYLYLDDWAYGLVIVDVSSPADPIKVSSFLGPYTSIMGWGVHVFGSYAYINDFNNGLIVVNISDPANPILAGSYFYYYYGNYGVFARGDYAYLTNWNTGLHVIDLNATDTDEDGMATHWENINDCLWWLTPDADSNPDGDNVVSLLEYKYDTDPCEGDVFSACSDGLDNDADNLIDWPNDPDCTSLLDDTEMDPSYAAHLGLTWLSQGIDMQGNYAYIASDSNLDIVDVSDPENPRIAGRVSTPGYAFDVVVRGNYAYVADWHYFTIVDVSDPAAPEVAGEIDYSSVPNSFLGIDVSGDYAYIVGSGGLKVINVSNPASPVEVGAYSQSDFYPECVLVRDGYAYVTGFSQTLIVLNVSNPASPAYEGFVSGVRARDIKRQGNYLYLAGWGDGLEIVDITNPASPTKVTSFVGPYTTLWSWGVHVFGSYAYLNDFNNGLIVVNISNPAAPILAGSYFYYYYGNFGVFARGDYAYLTNWNTGLHVIDLNATDTDEDGMATHWENIYTCLDWLTDDAAGNPDADAYTSLEEYKYDFDPCVEADELQTVAVGSYPRGSLSIFVKDNLAYLGVWSTLDIVDISDRSAPVRVGTLPLSRDCFDIKVVDNFAYIAAFAYFIIVDVSDPTLPELVAEVPLTSSVLQVDVENGFAYLTSGEGLKIFKVSNPYEPELCSTFLDRFNGEGLAVRDGLVYLSGGLQIVNVSDPYDPRLVGEAGTSEGGRDIQVIGNYAYASNTGWGMRIYDVRDPAHPTRVGTYQPADYAFWAIHVSGSYAYLPEHATGMDIVDISDPANPVSVGKWDHNVGFGNYRVFALGDYAYHVHWGYGLDIIDINPADGDGDGMASHWERTHACLDQAVPDGDGDPDFDGKLSLQEYNSDTDPCNP